MFRLYLMCAYGAMMALAGLIVDSALDSQLSNCAFNWDPEMVGKHFHQFQITELKGPSRLILLSLYFITKYFNASLQD